MTDPQWTIDENGYLAFHDKYDTTWDILDAAEGIKRGHPWAMDGYDALVAAVRDADLLRQIRAEFDSYEDLVGDPYDMSRFVGFLGEIFLAPPAPQGEGTDG